MENDCVQCHHSRFDHIGWKDMTPYAHTHTGCRIVGCGCLAYVPPTEWTRWQDS